MLKVVGPGLLLITCSVISVVAIDNDYTNCNCDDEGFWSVHNIIEGQRVSDFFIAAAYFSIPIELLCFISCSNFPFKGVLLQFIAFIVLCGLTHLLHGWSYYGPPSKQLDVSLTVAKVLTALVSCATAIALLTLIPLLLKFKVRELFLKQNVLELDQEVGIMKKQKEASLHVRMLTREIRKSLDKHTILYTTLVELSKTLDLHNCAVWMPSDNKKEMNLTYELRASSKNFCLTISVNDPDIIDIKNRKGVMVLWSDSALGANSGGGSEEAGAAAAIRMPMLRVSNFKGGTPELVDIPYAILVLVMPIADVRAWSPEEMEIVEVVADQVAVALSHAAVLEGSQLMRDKLREQNHALQQAKKNALMASQARESFQKVMSRGMRRPMHSIVGLLSMFQDENMAFEQKIIIDTLFRTSNVLSTLVNDVMEISAKDDGGFPLEKKTFQLHPMVKEACCLAKCLCVHKGFGFELDVQSSLPDLVIGDERRAFQVILHMVGHLLDSFNGGGTFIFRVFVENASGNKNNKNLGMWQATTQDEYVSIKFDIEITGSHLSDASVSTLHTLGRKLNSDEVREGLSFRMCKKLVQMMHGNIRMSLNPLGLAQNMNLVLRFLKRLSFGRALLPLAPLLEQANSYSQFRGLQVVLTDDDNVNRTVTKKLLEKLGCQVTAVSCGFECLRVLSSAEKSFRVVILDLHMPEMDGFEVAMRIRKYHSRNWPLIIAVTASAEDLVWEKCLQVGMNGVIRKPVLLRGMAEELRRALKKASDGR